jgi:NADH dehydrogenase FAD-containing subunit
MQWNESEVGDSVGVRARARVHRDLAKLGVKIERDSYAADVDASDLTLWAVANQVSDLAKRSRLAVNHQGRVLVDEFLHCATDPRIVAIGDSAAVPGQRMSCQTALPQGAHGANSLARELAGKAPKPYSMGYIGQNVSIGRRRGVIQIPPG